MSPYTALILLAISLTPLSAGALAAAAEDRPRMEDYPSSYAFLQALQAWNRSHPAAAPTQSSAPTPTDKPLVVDPTSELAPPPFEITGPESLETAVEKARNILHPDYKEKIRYHRSTHISFPLHSIDGIDMSHASVGDTLNLRGDTEAEKKADLEKLTLQMDQEQRKLQEKGGTDAPPLPIGPSAISPGTLGSGINSRVDITVSSH